VTSDWQAIHNATVDAVRNNKPIAAGPFAGVPLGLLTTTGAKTGTPRETLVTISRDGERYVIVASNGGAPTNPAWYHNLRRNPIVRLQIGGEKFTARAKVVEDPAERRRLYDQHAGVQASFKSYEAKTSRLIPVITLERLRG
jgi:deazaflavin-dependent oxidoreductase (nitroreductase family)